MFWADKIARDIISTGNYTPYWVDDMKTPSGRVHIGSLRGVVIHDLVYKALLDQGKEATFTYVFEDHDPMDGMPHYLDKSEWDKYMGQPLFTIPSPDGKAKSFAHYFAEEFQKVFNKVGCAPKILWTGDLYREGKMNKDIKMCLDKVDIIRIIYETTYQKKLPDTWYPFQVMCPNCKKESTTKVTGWDGEKVSFTCVVDAVDWTRGCGHLDTISPFSNDGNYVGKLTWKVEWPVKWKVIGVTVEGAGKDHMSAGGSHDIAKQICEQVLDYPVPYPVAYEFFLIGGKKMSSSKGLGSSSKEISEVLPPYLLRFLFTRTDYNQAIDFDPVGNMYIPDLYDEYDRSWQACNNQSDENLSRVFVLSQIDELPSKDKTLFLPRFRDVANFVQLPNINLIEKFANVKGSALSDVELEILREREKYAKIWIKNYAPAQYRQQMTEEIPKEIDKLSDIQKQYLKKIIPLINEHTEPETLQLALYQTAKGAGLSTKEAFAALYLSFLGKQHGPRAAWFLLQYPKTAVVERLVQTTK